MNPPSGSAMTGWSGRATQKTGDSPGTDCRLAWNEQPGNVVLLYAGAFARNQGGSRQAGWRRYGRADFGSSGCVVSGAAKVLDELKREGYTMLILSNCKIAYREANWKEFSMERWFSAFYDCESFEFAPKTEIIRQVQKSFPGPFLVIGDRYGDLECARACRSPFIGCRYGFAKENELDGADALADSVEELPDKIRKFII